MLPREINRNVINHWFPVCATEKELELSFDSSCITYTNQPGAELFSLHRKSLNESNNTRIAHFVECGYSSVEEKELSIEDDVLRKCQALIFHVLRKKKDALYFRVINDNVTSGDYPVDIKAEFEQWRTNKSAEGIVKV